jgi:hypothetical protein
MTYRGSGANQCSSSVSGPCGGALLTPLFAEFAHGVNLSWSWLMNEMQSQVAGVVVVRLEERKKKRKRYRRVRARNFLSELWIVLKLGTVVPGFPSNSCPQVNTAAL